LESARSNAWSSATTFAACTDSVDTSGSSPSFATSSLKPLSSPTAASDTGSDASLPLFVCFSPTSSPTTASFESFSSTATSPVLCESGSLGKISAANSIKLGAGSATTSAGATGVGPSTGAVGSRQDDASGSPFGIGFVPEVSAESDSLASDVDTSLGASDVLSSTIAGSVGASASFIGAKDAPLSSTSSGIFGSSVSGEEDSTALSSCVVKHSASDAPLVVSTDGTSSSFSTSGTLTSSDSAFLSSGALS
ncbi:hypothetical protein KCU91_g151, partial [Aureobasidium melanogenum]